MPPPSSPDPDAAIPPVAHVSTIGEGTLGAGAIKTALEVVAREAEPLAATFFRLDEDDEIAASIVHGTHRPPTELARAVSGWKRELDGIDPLAPKKLAALGRRVATLSDVVGTPGAPLEDGRLLRAYRRVGAINDMRLTVWDGERLVAGVTLWRALRSRPWSAPRRRALAALQPLIEEAYLSALRAESGADVLPATLTPRQREVVRLLAGGASNEEVARALYVSPNTAKSHTRAAMGKLGVASRRELAMRLTRDHATAPSPRTPAGDSPIRLGGDGKPGVVLALALGWAAERIGAAVGGCSLLSARLDHVAEAWGVDRHAGKPLDLQLACSIQRQLLPSSQPLQVVAQAVEVPARWRVAELDEGTARELLGERLASSGLEMPLAMALHAQGRVAGVVWLARRSSGADERREATRALRTVHPLLEMACAATLDEALPIVTAADLEHRGLTAREMSVARLAIGGDGNATIARKLGVSESMVKTHMTRVLAKCGVRNRAHLIALVGTDLAER